MAIWPYYTARWDKLRRAKLRAQPLCERCLELSHITPATQVDHNTPISQGGRPFPALDELNSLCISCHSRKTVEDASGTAWGVDEEGNPIDPSHYWNQ